MFSSRVPERFATVKEGDVLVFRDLNEILKDAGQGLIRHGWNRNMDHLTREEMEFIVTKDDIRSMKDPHEDFLRYVNDKFSGRTWTITLSMLEIKRNIREKVGDLYKCNFCHALYEEHEITDVENKGFVCSHCMDAYFHKCYHCGKLHYSVGMDKVKLGDLNGEQHFVCGDCLENYRLCEHCQIHYLKTDFWDLPNRICNKCSADYTRCECCNDVINIHHAHQYRGHLVCDVCYQSETKIHDYYYKPTPRFLGETQDNMYLGVELEVDKGAYKSECAEHVCLIEDSVYCKNDGSLITGFEIVSHPATLEYHMNSLKWADIFNNCKEYGFRGHDTTTCGVHVHVSRKFFGSTEDLQDLNIAKVILLVNRFWDTHIVKFSRRGADSLDNWAGKLRLSKNTFDDENSVIKKMKDEGRSRGRYVAVNLQNQNTIEFRIFRGTLNINTFFAILQFVETICKFAKNVSLDSIDVTSWNDIFGSTEYAELKNYNEHKGLL